MPIKPKVRRGPEPFRRQSVCRGCKKRKGSSPKCPSCIRFKSLATQSDITHKIGQRLFGLRVDHEMTQEELSKKFGLDRSFLSDIERGRKSISLPMLEVFVAGFRISWAELFEDL